MSRQPFENLNSTVTSEVKELILTNCKVLPVFVTNCNILPVTSKSSHSASPDNLRLLHYKLLPVLCQSCPQSQRVMTTTKVLQLLRNFACIVIKCDTCQLKTTADFCLFLAPKCSHPNARRGQNARFVYGLWWSLDWPYETAALARLVYAGHMERRPRQLVIARHGGGMTSHYTTLLAMGPGFRQVKDLRTRWRRRWRTSTRQGWPARTKRRCMLGTYAPARAERMTAAAAASCRLDGSIPERHLVTRNHARADTMRAWPSSRDHWTASSL